MSPKLEKLKTSVEAVLGARAAKLIFEKDALILEVKAAELLDVMTILRDDPAFRFSQLIDACGMDYADFADCWDGARFAVVYQLLSIEHNWRLRVRSFCVDDDFPMVDSVNEIWSSANWYEREAFDLYGIVFNGHPDLRRILTDYGFVGHPFRKDFPVTGNVEMRYDPEQQRVVYQPVTIEPREIVPRVIREEHYAGRK
jgi:NADH-quinone oxidoreductase subunit C